MGREREMSERKRGDTFDGGLQRWQHVVVLVLVLMTCDVSIGDLHTHTECEGGRMREIRGKNEYFNCIFL